MLKLASKIREMTSSELILGGFQPFGTTVCRRRSLNRFGSLGAAEAAGVSE